MPLPSLPYSQRPWSIAVQTAYQKLHKIYHSGSSYIDSGSVEAHCLQQYGQAIINDTYPLLLLLTDTAESESYPWNGSKMLLLNSLHFWPCLMTDGHQQKEST